MRFFDLSVRALAAAAMLSGVSADAPAAPAYGGIALSSATSTTTYYVTRTVLRIVETVTATGNGTESTYETTKTSTASSTITAVSAMTSIAPSHYGQVNATTVYGSNSMPAATYVSPPPSTGSASKIEALSFVAALGLVVLAL